MVWQERVKIPDEKMEYYKERAEMYVGADVSSDFYAWVFPKCDHVAVGTGTVIDKGDIKRFQAATRLRAGDKIEGGRTIRVEAHPIPEHPRPRRYAPPNSPSHSPVPAALASASHGGNSDGDSFVRAGCSTAWRWWETPPAT